MPFSTFHKIEIVERMQPIIFAAIGLWLFFFDVISRTPAYRAAEILPEAVWGCLFTGAAVFQFYATWTRRRKLRRTALFVASMLWTAWAWILFSSLSKGFGQIMYSSAAIASIWAFVRAKR